MIGESSSTEPGSDARIEARLGRSVSLDHAANLLGVSRRTIYNRIRQGRLQTVRTRGGSQRVLVDSLEGVNVSPADVLSKATQAAS